MLSSNFLIFPVIHTPPLFQHTHDDPHETYEDLSCWDKLTFFILQSVFTV